jgi:hypothetical protein
MTALSSPADAESVVTGARRVLVVTDPGVAEVHRRSIDVS